MKITKVLLKKIEIPFNVSFKHSSADRSVTESVWVEMHSDSGAIGYGESCPREYVTEENMDTVIQFFNDYIGTFQQEVIDLISLKNWLNSHVDNINKNPAAMCAVELAFLDLLAKDNDKTIESMLGQSELNERFKYSAVLGDSSIEVFESTLDRYMKMGFSDYKVKLSGELKKDQQKCEFLKVLSTGKARLRFDANNLWSNATDAIRYLDALDIEFFAIEEPLLPNMYSDMKVLMETSGKSIILDESFLRDDQFEHLKSYQGDWLINLRVSKMGGLLRSKHIVDYAKTIGMKVIIGAQVGETSLLTRAALTIASYAEDILVAQEGAFGDLLLEHDICEQPLMFGKYGELNIPANNEVYGFGFNEVDTKSFLSLSVHE